MSKQVSKKTKQDSDSDSNVSSSTDTMPTLQENPTSLPPKKSVRSTSSPSPSSSVELAMPILKPSTRSNTSKRKEVERESLKVGPRPFSKGMTSTHSLEKLEKLNPTTTPQVSYGPSSSGVSNDVSPPSGKSGKKNNTTTTTRERRVDQHEEKSGRDHHTRTPSSSPSSSRSSTKYFRPQENPSSKSKRSREAADDHFLQNYLRTQTQGSQQQEASKKLQRSYKIPKISKDTLLATTNIPINDESSDVPIAEQQRLLGSVQGNISGSTQNDDQMPSITAQDDDDDDDIEVIAEIRKMDDGTTQIIQDKKQNDHDDDTQQVIQDKKDDDEDNDMLLEPSDETNTSVQENSKDSGFDDMVMDNDDDDEILELHPNTEDIFMVNKILNEKRLRSSHDS